MAILHTFSISGKKVDVDTLDNAIRKHCKIIENPIEYTKYYQAMRSMLFPATLQGIMVIDANSDFTKLLEASGDNHRNIQTIFRELDISISIYDD